MSRRQSTDAAWEWWGRNHPYFGVLTEQQYQGQKLPRESAEEFFMTGTQYVDFLWSTIESIFEPGFRPSRALDFGCGVGRLTIPLARRVPRVTGIDISPSMLLVAQDSAAQYQAANIDFVESDDELSRLGEEQYDLIISFIVLQHIPVKRGYRLFERLVSHLSEGGIGALHFTYETPARPLDWRSPRQLLNRLRYRSHLINGLVNSLKGKPFDSPIPVMEMNAYDLTVVHKILHENACPRSFAQYWSQGGEGIVLFFRKDTERVA